MSSLYYALGIPAILSVCCLFVGVFSPAWLVCSMQIDTQNLGTYPGGVYDTLKQRLGANTYLDIDIWMGLWMIRRCYGSYGSELCNTVSTEELRKTLSSPSAIEKAGTQKLIDDWLALKSLAICSLLCVGFGLICIYILGRATEDRKRSYGLITSTCWLLTAIFILTAVGKQATNYNIYHLGSDVINGENDGFWIKYHTPWAIIVAGIGGAWAAVVTVITVLYLIYRKQQPSENDCYMLLEDKNGQFD